MPIPTEAAAFPSPRPDLRIRLNSIQVAMPRSMQTNRGLVHTGLVKRPVQGELYLGMRALEGDGCADLVHHGLVDQAICVFPKQHMQTLSEDLQLGQRVAGDFGENFSVDGIDERQVYIGDLFEVGQVLLEVSKARAPCHTLNQVWDCSTLAAEMGRRGLTGWYCQVLRPGVVAAGQQMVLVQRDAAAPTVRQQWFKRQAG